MNHLGVDWTLRSDGYEATNFGLLSGNAAWQKELTLKLIKAAVAAGAKMLILPECGHAYGALRWQGANFYGQPLPFEVLHISEFLSAQVRSGKLKLKKLDKSVTFHDPCQVSRRGGATQAPRDVLQALGADLREMRDSGDLGYCCGGGGGVVTIHRADDLRHAAFDIKIRQINATGAEVPVTSCANCRQTFDDGQAITSGTRKWPAWWRWSPTRSPIKSGSRQDRRSCYRLYSCSNTRVNAVSGLYIPSITPPPAQDRPALWFAFQRSSILVTESGIRRAALLLRPDRTRHCAVAQPLPGATRRAPLLRRRCDDAHPLPDGWATLGLRDLFGMVDDTVAALSGRAFQIIDWERNHQFCSRCGTPMRARTDERARACPRAASPATRRYLPQSWC